MKTSKLFALAVVLLGLATLPLHATETGTFDRTLQVSGPVDLDVTSGSGNISVHSGGSGSVIIHATIRARDSWSGLSAQEKIKRLQSNPPIEQQGNTIHVGRIDDRELQQNVSIDYDLTVPSQTKLSSQTGSGDQSVRDLQLAVNARTGSGNITAENIGANLRVRSGSGNLKINSVKAGLDAEAGSGNIHARGVSGDISVNAGSGDIEVEQVAAGSVRAGTGSGNIRLYGIKGTLRAETGSGDVTVDGEPTGDWRVGAGSGNIDLKVPSGASFDIDARTSSGSLNLHHPVSMEGTVSRNHVHGKVGSGGVLVDLHTGSGDIQLN
jgi:DUF4097 and DUF4098 domain-containing protein YvlB